MKHIYGVRSSSKCNWQIKRKWYSYQKICFLTFFNVSTANANALFAAFQPFLEGPCKVVFAQRPDDPLPLRLKLTMSGPPAPSSAWGTENSLLGPSQASKRGGGSPGSAFGQELLHFLGGVHRGIVPVEHPVSRAKARCFVAKSLQEFLLR
jgi:hypothetical protein